MNFIEHKRKEESDRNKIGRIWCQRKEQLVNERGVWEIEKKHTGLTRYKYDKTEDNCHRRMRLKIDKHASKATYLTKDAYEEAKYKKASSNSEASINGSLFDISNPRTNFLSTSNYSEFSPKHSETLNLSMRKLSSDTYFKDSLSSPIRLRKMTSDVSHDDRNNTVIHEEVKEDEISESGSRRPTREATSTIKLSDDNDIYTDRKRKEKKEKSRKFFCERITVRGAIWGELELSENSLTFIPSQQERPNQEKFAMGTLKQNFVTSTKKKRWSYSRIKEIYKRRFNYVLSAFEIFTSDNKPYYFNLIMNVTLIDVLNELKLRCKTTPIYHKESFIEQELTKQWTERKMSNFDYLMKLNMFSGRSYNDLTQYPVFPWVLADYTSEELNLNPRNEEEAKKTFRDLGLPIGALRDTEERHEYLKGRIDIDEYAGQKTKIEPSDDGNFMYGSHYSTGGHIIDYLVRVEPFTTLQINLQSGKFDDANRIFSSIPRAWQSYLAEQNSQNFKELVPEFFYDPSFLKNR